MCCLLNQGHANNGQGIACKFRALVLILLKTITTFISVPSLQVTTYWLPLIQKSLGGAEHNRSVLLIANKSDQKNEISHIDKMVPIMNGGQNGDV